MELSLNRLRMLRELARCGTLTEAAAALHYTPSAVSQQLAALEREVCVPLLEHVGRRVRLTETGRVLAQHAEEILAAEERARIALEQARETLTADLTVGVLATLAGTLVPPTLATLAERHPGVRVKTREVVPEETQSAVRDGDLDLAFVLDYPAAPGSAVRDSALECTLIGVEQLHLVAPHGSLGAPTDPRGSAERPPPAAALPRHTGEDRTVSGAPVELADLAECSWVASGTDTEFGRALLSVCRAAGFTPHIAHQIDEQSTAMAMVAMGLGVTLVAELALPLRPVGVDVFPFREPIRRRITVIRRTSTRDRPSERAFVRAALDTATSLRLLKDPADEG
ncbi:MULTISPECIES: LysR substrate-binding domain-containing protein [unclassified Streptomyces]|uniref:LysR family transcriptional regulator n=1 Tax=unclassified Streptomyces TaxID=2593676 RepID=UPI002DDA7058|nr:MULTISPECIES: LysR substrate-binding domain-containing protein [unclassified Streptomyces]WSA90674.1 LysR substrate-binding domain-containing protein [Streptomyces sp. NBC_01795]WSB74999.1 LysR substrate-binding domain-containing protein [Streptomyces sp. NBC_01775]WSS16722.1 LysR substrate-binding domain-containing protein [Streptomyces sp. NBC_01186]WSS45540.1 LysR substrate-binding domain-containing protein [Streptomyces sp. NBC_01187]